MALGSFLGGTGGAVVGAPSGPGAIVTTAAGAALGAGVGLAGGQLLTDALFSTNSSSSSGSNAPQYQVPASGKSAAEAARDVPSWAKGNRPLVGENGKSFAKRLMDEQYGKGKWKDTGPGSEYNKVKKWGDRGFENPR